MISEMAKGVKRIVHKWEKLNVGKTNACQYKRALREAELLKKYEENWRGPLP